MPSFGNHTSSNPNDASKNVCMSTSIYFGCTVFVCVYLCVFVCVCMCERVSLVASGVIRDM